MPGRWCCGRRPLQHQRTHISVRSFDKSGSYTIGLKEQLIFPEIDYDKIDFSNIEGCHQELELPLTELEFTED